MRSQLLVPLAILTLVLAIGTTGHGQVMMRPLSPQVTYMSERTTYFTPYATRLATPAPTWAPPSAPYMEPTYTYVAPTYVAPDTAPTMIAPRPTMMAPRTSYRPWITGRPVFSGAMRSAVPYGPVGTFYR
jgi:hypothetical protein